MPLGKIGAGSPRAKFADGTTENRGGESTLGNLVAEVQRWATQRSGVRSAQIAFMNPGGLRDRHGRHGQRRSRRRVTYKQAADVQPFANTLVNMDLTGAQIKTVLEQQWQRRRAHPVASVPEAGRLEGLHYTYDPPRGRGHRITGMWLDGVAIDPGTTYSVTVNSFLAIGW